VAYGSGTEPRHLAVNAKTFLQARFEYGVAHIYQCEVDGGDDFKAIVKAVDRDPVSRQLTHIDLFAVDMTKPIRLKVRVDLVGKPAGAIDGGLLQQVKRRIEIQCLPGQIPSHLEVDVTPLKLGDSLHLSDLKLPEGVKTVAASDEAVAIVAAPDTKDEVATTTEGAEDADAAAAKKD